MREPLRADGGLRARGRSLMARFINQQVLAVSSIGLSRQIVSGDNQARPTVIDSRSILAGVQGFESLSPHKSCFIDSDLVFIHVTWWIWRS